MPPTHPPDFEHAIHTANIWLKAVSEALGREGRHLAHRVLRTWLHTLRDRVTIDVAAHFAAQLPDLLRGAYYDGWDPSAVPIKYDREGYVNRFVQEAKVGADDVPRIVPAVTAVVREHVSPGQLEAALEQLPHDIRALLLPSRPPDRALRTRSVPGRRPGGAGQDLTVTQSGDCHAPFAHRTRGVVQPTATTTDVLRPPHYPLIARRVMAHPVTAS